MLDAQALTKSYGQRQVVAGLSLQLRAGEIVGLLGPNGAGKSTTVAMLCGLVAPDSGQVRIQAPGQPPGVMGAGNPALKRRIGLVPQDLALHEELSAEANLRLFGALYGLGGDRLRQPVQAALELVGLADRARDKAASFSGGMKRRLNIACALVHEPDILLFDEPTVGVDPQSRNAIFDNLETLRDRGKALLYTTHYLEEAERLCDRLVVMDHGRVVAADTLAGLLQRLPGVQTLALTVSGTVDLAALARDTGASGASQAGPALQLGLAGGPDLAAPAAAVLAWLAGHGHQVSQLASNPATLEDVFLALTGRQLRD
jgi:ABC-2 type transport system ATP-binding protein